ncbi:MAG: MBL fold metallo-hydrolase [Chloroflexi bacterium]|nr:MBL fold metallo-hydrolase [Chloroflexota bacterium]
MSQNFSATPIRIELPFLPNEGSVNVYLFREPELVLIDAGFRSEAAWQALQAGLAEQHVTVADLTRVIITHPHVDHYGFAARIAREGQAEIWMADVGVQWLSHFLTLWPQRIAYYQEHFLPGLGSPPVAESFLRSMHHTLAAWEPIPADRIVSFSTRQPLHLGGLAWQIYHLTGHDRQLTCFYQPESRQLLSSDMLMMPTATSVTEAPLPGESRRPTLPDFLQSLDQLAALAVETVYPGHGAPFINHRQVIGAQQMRIHARKEECWRQVVAGVETVADLFEQLYGARAQQVGMAGLWMVVGYLDLLQAEGRLTVETINNVWHFRPAS